MNLHERQCLNHAEREAVARCPECRQFFCRECVAEHDDRVVCAACLRKILRLPERKKTSFTTLARAVALSFSLFTAWLAFYWLGKILLQVPTKFHDGSLWQTGFLDQ
jgi:hypothetical protein